MRLTNGRLWDIARIVRPVASFAGISIGSINAAIIAGNPPETRVETSQWAT
jgi:predicted acylesterase/phospholipase RssA